MSTDYTTEFPLMLVGTDVLENPSFEDFPLASHGWTPSGTVVQEFDLVHPCGFVSAKLSSGASLVQAISITDFGLSALPAWASAVCLAVCCRGSNGSIAIGATSASMANESNKWNLCYVEAAAVDDITIIGGSGDTYVDSVMFGFVVDVPIFMTDWNAVTKAKQETRETPFNIMTQLQSDAPDLKASFNAFDGSFRNILNNAIRYWQRGHYYAMILDRKNSGNFADEILPYLAYNSQDSPKFIPGAPDVFTMSLNGRGNLP